MTKAEKWTSDRPVLTNIDSEGIYVLAGVNASGGLMLYMKDYSSDDAILLAKWILDTFSDSIPEPVDPKYSDNSNLWD